jgi:glucose/arabinose dehydrogenase
MHLARTWPRLGSCSTPPPISLKSIAAARLSANTAAGIVVVFVPFKDGRPDDMAQDVVTGFLNDDNQAHGRPAVLRSTSQARC